MNNFIEYFYKIPVKKISYHNNYYAFDYNNYHYKLYHVYENIDINFIINISKQLLGITLISEIILNKDNNYISDYNNKKYVLIKIYSDVDMKITLDKIIYFDNKLFTKGLHINWGMLWSKKIDYLENMINENGIKYPILVDSFNYFVGMVENAISYYNNIIIPSDYVYVLSHKTIKFDEHIDTIYNPLNIMFDYKARDIAEYIKSCFFSDNGNLVFNELDKLINSNYINDIDIKLIIARLLYPSFYFDLYDDILIYKADEKILLNIVSKCDEYEKYLLEIIDYFKKNYDIDSISWLEKNSK